jgi:hypothetical protein
LLGGIGVLLLLLGTALVAQWNTPADRQINPMDELGKFLMVGVQFVPLAVLGLLAYIGAKRPWGHFLPMYG